jgi:hypothetical protein
MKVLQREPGRLVVLEEGGTVVRKIYSGDEPNRLYDLAAREFDRLRRFRDALSGLGGATCPQPLEIRSGASPFIRMERAAGVSMEDYLNDKPWSPELYESVGRTLQEALPRYIQTFGEPYWDFIIRNMFFDPDRRLVTFLDFGIPESYGPLLEELSRYSALEFSLGTLAASPVFESRRPKRIIRRREHRQAFALVSVVLRRFRDAADGNLKIEEVREAARITYALAADTGGRFRRGWYSSAARILTEPMTRIDRLCDPNAATPAADRRTGRGGPEIGAATESEQEGRR